MKLFDRPKAIERKKAVGARMFCARQFVEPNRSEFARRVGVDVSTIRKIEDGERGASRELLEHIAHILRVSMDYLEWGSLSGVDPEMAAHLQERCQPEIAGRTRTNATADTRRRPKTLAVNSSYLGQ